MSHTKVNCTWYGHTQKIIFSKNLSLITLNAVSYCDIGAYSGDSPYTTRHHTHHHIHCILLRT